MVASQKFSFYANLDTLDTSSDFSSWSLDVLNDEDFNIEIQGIDALTQDSYVGGFRFFSSFDVPTSGMTDGRCYVLAIVNSSSEVLYLSNSIMFRTNATDDMTEIRYRNGVDIFNFGYANNGSLYNRFHINLAFIQPAYSTRTSGYNATAGSFKRAVTATGYANRFITRAYNADDGEAFASATLHETFEIKELGNWENYSRRDNSDYVQDWIGEYPLAHGEITLEKDSTFASSKAL